MAITIREADAATHLSRLMDRAEAGEDVRIVRDGGASVRLEPVPDASDDREARVRRVSNVFASVRAAMKERGATLTVDDIIEARNEGRR